MPWPLWLAPLVILAELTQLVLAERAIGVKVLNSGLDPREAPAPSSTRGWLWFGCAALGVAYPGVLVLFGAMRLQALVMILATVIGYQARRQGGLRLALVALTFEGAIRIALIAQMLILQLFFGSPRLPGLGRFFG